MSLLKKWVNRFTPLYVNPKPSSSICDIPQKTVIDATGNVSGIFEEVTYTIDKGDVTGWVYSFDLEDYIPNLKEDVVVIENQTPNKYDLKQYIDYNGVKQVNMCGQLSVAYIAGISLGTVLSVWKKEDLPFYKKVFSSGKARGTGPGELQTLLRLFGRESVMLSEATKQSHINRSRYTMESLNNLLSANRHVIASVRISSISGQVLQTGTLHWVVLSGVIPRRNDQGNIVFYNPAMNQMEDRPWDIFLASAGNPYGLCTN